MTCPCSGSADPILYFPAGTAARFRQAVTVVGSDPVTPADLTGATVIVILKQALTLADDATGNVTLTVANGGIEIAGSPTLGLYDLIFLPETTATLADYVTWYAVPRITFSEEDIQVPRSATLRLRLDPIPEGDAFCGATLIRGDLYTSSTHATELNPPPLPPYATEAFVEAAVAAEALLRATADTALAGAITAETQRAQAAEQANAQALIVEASARTAGDSKLQTSGLPTRVVGVADGSGVDCRAAFLAAKAVNGLVHFHKAADGVYYFETLEAGDLVGATISADAGVVLSFPNDVQAADFYAVDVVAPIRILYRNVTTYDWLQPKSPDVSRPLGFGLRVNERTLRAVDVAAEATFLNLDWPIGDVFGAFVPSSTSARSATFDAIVADFYGAYFEVAIGEKISAHIGGDYGPNGVIIRGAGGYVAVWVSNTVEGFHVSRKLTGEAQTDSVSPLPGSTADMRAIFQPAVTVWSATRKSAEVVAIAVNGRVILEVSPSVGEIIDVGFAGYDLTGTGQTYTVNDVVIETSDEAVGLRDIETLRIFGDSMSSPAISAWPRYLKQLVDGQFGMRLKNVVNYAVSGQNSANQLSIMEGVVFGTNEIAVIYIGTNDVQGLTNLATFRTQIEAMADEVLSAGSTPIFVSPWFWYGQAQNGGNGQNAGNYLAAGPYRAAVKRICAEKGLRFVDLTAELPFPDVSYVGQDRQLLRDNIHEDWFGGQLMAEVIAKAIISVRAAQ